MSETSPENAGSMSGQFQILFAEKRTALAYMRTALAMLALPMSVLSLLIATSRYYKMSEVVHLMLPLLAICGCLVAVSGYLIVRTIKRLHAVERKLDTMKERFPELAELVVD